MLMWGCNEIHNRCWARRSRLFSPAASGGYTFLLAPATQEGGNDHAVVSPIGASLCCVDRPVDGKRVRGRSPPAEQRSVHQQHQSASDRGRARYVRIRYDDRLRFPGGPFLQRRRLGHRLCHFDDGGKTFTSGFLPDTTFHSTPANLTYERVSDPSVAFDAKANVWMISYLGIPAALVPVDVLASRSIDGGLTWGNPVVITADRQFNDKNWSVCDNTASSPHYGNCYTEFDDASLSDLEQMSTSSDGGVTWGAPLATAQHLHGIGGQPLVQPNGTVIVPVGGFASRGG